MIIKLENLNEEVANDIFNLFQASYKVEALLIGANDFPPLSRGTKDIISSKTQFFGFYLNKKLAGIIELSIEDGRLDIDSLTVSPLYFKKGIAGKLINYAINEFNYSLIVVETAVANMPAINLYKKHGFVEFKRWTPSHGIEKLAMSIKRINPKIR